MMNRWSDLEGGQLALCLGEGYEKIRLQASFSSSCLPALGPSMPHLPYKVTISDYSIFLL
jgi:hypothetical protein